MPGIRLHQTLLIPTIILFLSAVTGTSLYAKERSAQGKPILPGEVCQTKPLKSWTPQEKWVWDKVCRGETADFNAAEGYGGTLDPKGNKEWPGNRILSPTFMETILLHEPYRGTLSRYGVHIVGARFKEPLDLVNADLSHQLLLEDSRFESDVYLDFLKTFRCLSLSGSKFTGKLDMNGIEIVRDSLLMEKAEFGEVDLGGAKIGNQLVINGSKFTGKLDMNGTEIVRGSLLMEKAEFGEVDLRGAKIGAQLGMVGSKFTGKLDMDGIKVDEILVMDKAKFDEVILAGAKIGDQLAIDRSKFTGKLVLNGIEIGDLFIGYMGKAEFGEVDLRGAKIRGYLLIKGSKFTGKLDMISMVVGGKFSMVNAEFGEPLVLIFAKIDGNLDLSGSTFASIDLTGTHVRGDFVLGPPVPRWLAGAKLILRNTEVGVLVDSPDSWPDKLELDGFTYTQLGGFASDGVTTRKISSFIEALEKQSYSPQPYEQLARTLLKQGHRDKAIDVLYTAKNRERSEATGVIKAWLILYWLSVGYGYRIYNAFFWFLVFIIFGAVVLKACGQDRAHRLHYWGVAFSLDMLLPIIKLRERHYKIDLKGCAGIYFYVHKLVGYVLVTFLIAGLSSLIRLS